MGGWWHFPPERLRYSLQGVRKIVRGNGRFHLAGGWQQGGIRRHLKGTTIGETPFPLHPWSSDDKTRLWARVASKHL